MSATWRASPIALNTGRTLTTQQQGIEAAGVDPTLARQRISWSEREAGTRRNRARLEHELLAKQLRFESRPYEAHVQFSNFCNMSCVMCWDGENPPLRRMSPALLDSIAAEVAPNLAVITPHNGSEPLLVTWQDTLRIAREHRIRLALTTNGQFFDETRFEEVRDVLEMLVLSIDSHIPEVYAKIRVGSKPEEVFRNLRTTARLSRQHGIACLVQVVLMTENAASLPETVAFMANAGVGAVNVIRMVDVNGRSDHLDAVRHFSADYLEALRKRCVAVAHEHQIALGWEVGRPEWLDFRPAERRITPPRTKLWNDYRDEQLRLRHPGFCRQVHNRLRIDVDGAVGPCAMATDRELDFGDLTEHGFEAIWNGPAARDLRRAHYTWDYPSVCSACRFTDLPQPMPSLPLVERFERETGGPAEPCIEIASPAHMLRGVSAPTIALHLPAPEIERWALALSLGGTAEDLQVHELPRPRVRSGRAEFDFTPKLWSGLTTNVGYWWAVFAFVGEGSSALRTTEVRCLVRHEPLERVVGSPLRYRDQGHAPKVDLGGGEAVGWQEQESRAAPSGVKAIEEHL